MAAVEAVDQFAESLSIDNNCVSPVVGFPASQVPSSGVSAGAGAGLDFYVAGVVVGEDFRGGQGAGVDGSGIYVAIKVIIIASS